MKEKIYCNWLKISLGIIFLGSILDIGVAVTDISLFTVTESYMAKTCHSFLLSSVVPFL